MKSIRKFIALMLMLWTPLFFTGATYAATQMEMTNAITHTLAQKNHTCHQANTGTAHPQDSKHATGDSHCQHCSFCASFAAPLNEISTQVIPQPPSLAFKAMWASSTHNITPDHRPPIDA